MRLFFSPHIRLWQVFTAQMPAYDCLFVKGFMRLRPIGMALLFILFTFNGSAVFSQKITGSDSGFSKPALQNQPLPEPVPRKNYHAKFEPAAGILHGAGQSASAFKAYTKAMASGEKPQLFMDYISLCSGALFVKLWGYFFNYSLSRVPTEVMPQIGISMVGGKDNGKGRDKKVAEGKYDKEIAALVRIVQKIDRPCFVRIGYEFDGSWNGYHADTYRQAFIRITQALRGANANVATVWCSGGGSANKWNNMPQLMSYYPGDEWVDWWGVDLFDAREFATPQLQNYLKEADAHAKPVMIGETTPRGVGVLKGDTSWHKWFVPFFKCLYENPGIKAFCYINWEWAAEGKRLGFKWDRWGDARLQMNEFVRKAYVGEMKKKIFLHLKTDDR